MMRQDTVLGRNREMKLCHPRSLRACLTWIITVDLYFIIHCDGPSVALLVFHFEIFKMNC